MTSSHVFVDLIQIRGGEKGGRGAPIFLRSAGFRVFIGRNWFIRRERDGAVLEGHRDSFGTIWQPFDTYRACMHMSP